MPASARRGWYLLALGVRQVTARPLRWLVLALGVALALVVPVVSASLGSAVAAQAVRTAIQELPMDQRAMVVSRLQPTQENPPLAEITGEVRGPLSRISSRPVRVQVVYKQIDVRGSTFFLAGTDSLRTAVHLTSGRWPRYCRPDDCEVVLAGGGNENALSLSAGELGVHIVGRTERTDPALVGGRFNTGSVPLLVGDGVTAVAALDKLTLFARTYAWGVAIDPDRIISLGVPRYVALATEVSDDIAARVPQLAVARPDRSLLAADERASASARRFTLLGSAAAMLLLGFAVLAAVSHRREHAALAGLLRRRGTSVPGLVAGTLVIALTVALIGLAVALLLGAVAAAWFAHQAGLPFGRTLTDAYAAAAPAMTVLVLAGAVVTAATMLWRPPDPAAARRGAGWALAVVIATIALIAARGAVGPDQLGSSGDVPITALPVLVCLATGLVAALLWRPSVALFARWAPRRWVTARLALSSAAGRPLRPTVTAGFLAAALAAFCFASGYAATLLNSAADQAAEAVPLDARIAPGTEVVSPVTIPELTALPRTVPGAEVFGVSRSSGTIRAPDGSSNAVALIGVPPVALTRQPHWAAVTGSDSNPDALARRLTTTVPPDPTVPAGRTITVPVHGTADQLRLSVTVAGTDGREAGVELVARGDRLVGSLPRLGAGPLRVRGVSLSETIAHATRRQHAIGEGSGDVSLLGGRITLGTPSVDGVPVAGWSWSGWGADLATVKAGSAGLSVSYLLQGWLVVVSPHYVASPVVNVVVDSRTARSARHGLIRIAIGHQSLLARVVGVFPRFPATSTTFVIADQKVVSDWADRWQPGTGGIIEDWVSAPASSQQRLAEVLGQQAFAGASVWIREPLHHQLVHDPVARGSRELLLVVGLLVLAMAAVGVVVLALAERSDDAAALLAWEADGLPPNRLRRILATRGWSVVVLAVPLGVAGGAALTALGAGMVAVNATGTLARPPLQVAVSWPWLLAVGAVSLAAAAAAVGVVVSRQLRERHPVIGEVRSW